MEIKEGGEMSIISALVFSIFTIYAMYGTVINIKVGED